VLKVGILFFKALDLLPVHEAGAYWPDVTAPVTLLDREDDEDGPSVSGSADGSEPLFGLRVARVGQNNDRAGEYALDI
jgi:hypothetical protein